ncbi:MAG: GNAT family N-acetyltransferase, partial [Amphiplicatus sp.]
EDSREHLTRWEPSWPPGSLTPESFRRRLKGYWREMRRGGALPLLIFRCSNNALVGGITLSNIRYGASRSATLGYWVGARYVRRGYARAALAAVLDHAFRQLELNRVEAACQPDNLASRMLLEGAGFAFEGRAQDYLRINDAWRDHLLYAITASAFSAGRARG